MNNKDEFSIAVSPMFKDLTKFDLLSAEWFFCGVIGVQPEARGLLFGCYAPAYFLECRTNENYFELARNGIAVKVPIPTSASEIKVILSVWWKPDTLGISIKSSQGKFEDERNTPIVFPPCSLREWARRQLIIPRAEYSSAEEVHRKVIEYLLRLDEKIAANNAANSFWDIKYDGRKEKSPKRETDIHPTIQLLLDDLEIMHGIQVTPEYRTGAGSLDFLFSARGKKHTQLFHVCLEVKRAHSPDLVSGLMEQLPKYMETKNADYGIYCVLDFGEEYVYQKSKFSFLTEDLTETIDLSEMPLEAVLSMATNRAGRRIRTVLLNLSQQTSPSKLAARKT